MFRIDGPTAVGVLPAPQPAGTPGYFNHAPPGSGQTPTIVTSDWCNGIQEELMSVLAFSGIAADKDDNGQLLAAILAMLDGAGVNGAGSIFGLELANTPSFETTRVTIAAGLCRDSTNSAKIALGAPISKRLDAAWASGSGNGGRDTGALANGQTWHVFAIFNPTTEAVDGLFSQSPTAPTLPAGFTKFRRLGAVILEAASTAIRLFKQTGDWFELATRSTDYANQANGGGVPYYRLVTSPDGIVTEVELYFQSQGTISAVSAMLSGVFNAAHGAPVAFGGAAQWAQVRRIGTTDSAGGTYSYGTTIVRQFTDTSRHVYTFSSDTADVIAMGVIKWRDERGKFF